MSQEPKIPVKARPYMPWECKKPIVVAIQAVAAGIASPDQQKLFMRWLIEVGCGTYNLPYFPDNERDSVFATGKAFVGQQLVRQIKLKVGQIKEKKNG
jgi:hypothetical protein